MRRKDRAGNWVGTRTESTAIVARRRLTTGTTLGGPTASRRPAARDTTPGTARGTRKGCAHAGTAPAPSTSETGRTATGRRATGESTVRRTPTETLSARP